MLEELRKLIDMEECGNSISDIGYGLTMAVDWIRYAPALDVAPVVRCKDCYYLAKDGESMYCAYHDNINVTEEFYCATGEEKDADTRKPV